MAIGNSTGTFAPYITITASSNEDRSSVYTRNGRTVYSIDLRYRKINEVEHIKWCRRNLGERGNSWDFWMANKMLHIEVWGSKEKFIYEMWKN